MAFYHISILLVCPSNHTGPLGPAFSGAPTQRTLEVGVQPQQPAALPGLRWGGPRLPQLLLGTGLAPLL